MIMRWRGTCDALLSDLPPGDGLAVEGHLLPLELSCFLNRAKPYSCLGNVLWCNHGDVRVASEIFSVKGQEVGDAVNLH